MKKDIHPPYYPNATVVCACGNSWQTGSTVEVIHTDVCSKCHPFYTGEQRIVDTEGQVDRFYKRLQAREDYLHEIEERAADRTSPDLPIVELELGTRPESALTKAGLENVGQVMELLEEGDGALLAIDGFGRKSLADLKRALRKRGFKLPEEALETEAA
ncbi:MAG: 50S ribosomal protein L31 [Anaerolineaceae bacterium]|nr:MAG: 50S ribosomal protein L31 [Anaerolineaceae bacterium]